MHMLSCPLLDILVDQALRDVPKSCSDPVWMIVLVCQPSSTKALRMWEDGHYWANQTLKSGSREPQPLS